MSDCKKRPAYFTGDGISTPAFDMATALDEGWLLIENSDGWCEIQADDEKGLMMDEEAFQTVATLAMAGSYYHCSALRYINDYNQEVLQTGADPSSGTLVMERRTWEDESVRSRECVLVRADIDLAAGSSFDGPWDRAGELLSVSSNQDLVFPGESVAVPDVTFGLSAFTYAKHTREDATRFRCEKCREAFFPCPTTRSHYKIVLAHGQRSWITRCPGCGSLGFSPVFRRVGVLKIARVSFDELERSRRALHEVVGQIRRHRSGAETRSKQTLRQFLIQFNDATLDALEGLTDMLDYWSDNRNKTK